MGEQIYIFYFVVYCHFKIEQTVPEIPVHNVLYVGCWGQICHRDKLLNAGASWVSRRVNRPVQVGVNHSGRMSTRSCKVAYKLVLVAVYQWD